MLEVEEKMDMAAIPAAARAAHSKLSASGKITKVEALTKDGKTSYEAAVLKKGKITEIAVTAGGGDPLKEE